MPAVALSRVLESGPGGEDLAAGTWQRLEALPDPRSPRGRIYPLACLIAIAVCAFTAVGTTGSPRRAGIRRAGQADLARLSAPWDPLAGRYRAPDEKTIRVVLDCLDPRALARALARALLGGGPGGGPPGPGSVRGYRARRATRQAKMLARGRLRAMSVDGKTSHGARRADGTRAHLLGVAEHGGHLLDHLEVDVKHRRDQPLHRAAGPGGPGRRHGHLRRPHPFDVTVREDTSASRTGSGARQPGHHPGRHHRGNQASRLLHIPEGRRDHTTPRRNPPPPRPRLGQKRTITDAPEPCQGPGSRTIHAVPVDSPSMTARGVRSGTETIRTYGRSPDFVCLTASNRAIASGILLFPVLTKTPSWSPVFR